MSQSAATAAIALDTRTLGHFVAFVLLMNSIHLGHTGIIVTGTLRINLRNMHCMGAVVCWFD